MTELFLRPYFNWMKVWESITGMNMMLWCLRKVIHSSSVWENTSHRVLRGCPLLSSIWGLLVCLAWCPSANIAQGQYLVNMKGNLFFCRNPWDYRVFHMLVTENRSSFPYSPPPAPIVFKLFTNKVKSTSSKHLMLELICMQNTWYWIRCRKHYSLQKYATGIMVSSSESDKLPSVWKV